MCSSRQWLISSGLTAPLPDFQKPDTQYQRLTDWARLRFVQRECAGGAHGRENHNAQAGAKPDLGTVWRALG